MKTAWLITLCQQYFSLAKLCLLTLAIAILLRILYVGSRELWYDEVLSLLLSTSQKSAYHSPGDMVVMLNGYTHLLHLPVETGLRDFLLTLRNLLKSLLGGEPHPVLFFLMQHFWLRLWGYSEIALRSLDLIISIVSLFSAYGLGKHLLGHRSGLVLAALLSVNPFYLFHSLNMRMYAPLILWTTLSAWSLLRLIDEEKDVNNISSNGSVRLWYRQHQLLWNGLLIFSVACGLLTFYLYAYWLIVLGVLAIYLDRQHWFRHGLRLGIGGLVTLPWILWGTIKQLHNADIDRFSKIPTNVNPWLQHLQDFCQTIATDLLVGDWTTSMSSTSLVLVGCLVVGALIYFSFALWKQGEKKNLVTALILGILPIMLSLFVDIITNKFTLGFGWGRTMIIIIPGCLFLITLWLEKVVTKQWSIPIAMSLLLLYLTISIGDFSWRHRSMFHTISELVSQSQSQPILIAMNSKAWGHVLRLVYYIPSSSPVMLLAQNPADLANSLTSVILELPEEYPRIIWLDSFDPVWSKLPTSIEVDREREKVQRILSSRYQLKQSVDLVGTMSLDHFTASVYVK